MVPVRDYEKRCTEAFAITKIRTFKHEAVFSLGRGEVVCGTIRYV